jgi:hypothetical protein
MYCSGESARLTGHDYAACPRALHTPRYAHASSVTRMLCYLAVATKYFFIHPRQIAMGHVVTLEPSQAGRRDPELWDTWWRQSSLEWGGGVRSRETHGGAGALMSGEVGSGAVGHVAHG